MVNLIQKRWLKQAWMIPVGDSPHYKLYPIKLQSNHFNYLETNLTEEFFIILSYVVLFLVNSLAKNSNAFVLLWEQNIELQTVPNFRVVIDKRLFYKSSLYVWGISFPHANE